MTTFKKQTAGNNAFLADVKYHFNKPLFAMATKMVNENSAGPEAGARQFRNYLAGNITRDLDFVDGLGTGRRHY